MNKALYIVFISAFVALAFADCNDGDNDVIQCLTDHEYCFWISESSSLTSGAPMINCTCIEDFGKCLDEKGCKVTANVSEESNWGVYMRYCLEGNCSCLVDGDPFPPCADFKSRACTEEYEACINGGASDSYSDSGSDGDSFECTCIKAYGECLKGKKCDEYSKLKEPQNDLWYNYIEMCYINNQCTGCLGEDPATHCYKQIDDACKEAFSVCTKGLKDNPLNEDGAKKKKHNYTDFCACTKTLGECVVDASCNDTKNSNWMLYLTACNGKAECGNCLAEDPNAGAVLSSITAVFSAILFAAFF